MPKQLPPMNEWNEKYALNINSVDEQHKKLFALAYDVEKAIYDGRGDDILDDAFQRMISYVQEHFTDEEKLMANISYPDRKKHRNQHDEFTKKIIELQEKRDKGLKNIALHIALYLKKWFVSHIKEDDMNIALYIASAPADEKK